MKLKASFSVLYLVYTAVVPILTSLSAGAWVLWIEKAGPANFTTLGWLFLWFMAVIVSGFSIMPTSVVALLVGYLGGIAQWPYLVLTYILATILGHYLAKIFNSKDLMQWLLSKPKAQTMLQNLNQKPALVVALARLSPVFPFGVSNVVFTYLGTPLFTLLWAGVLGMLPRSIFLLWVGSQASSMITLFNKNQFTQNQVIWLVIGVFAAIGVMVILFKKNKLTI